LALGCNSDAGRSMAEDNFSKMIAIAEGLVSNRYGRFDSKTWKAASTKMSKIKLNLIQTEMVSLFHLITDLLRD
jgi:hypothetical protein